MSWRSLTLSLKMPKRMTTLKNICLIALMLMNASCASRVIYVPNGQPVRLAESIKTKVWILDSNGKAVRSKNKITIPEGWYALPKE